MTDDEIKSMDEQIAEFREKNAKEKEQEIDFA